MSTTAVVDPKLPAAHSLWYAAGTELLRATGIYVLFAATGLLNAPDKSAVIALSWALLFGTLSTAGRVLQKYVPFLTWKSVIPAKYETVAAWADQFTRAAVASFLTTITGWLAAPDFSTLHSIGLAAVIGAALAGARALQGLVTPGEAPAPDAPG